jgi:hypothetical protein
MQLLELKTLMKIELKYSTIQMETISQWQDALTSADMLGTESYFHNTRKSSIITLY